MKRLIRRILVLVLKRENCLPLSFLWISIKNKPSSLSSESELEISDLSDTSALPPIIEMASSDTSASTSASNIVIPPSELAKIAEMLKDTFRGEIVNLVDSVVQGVLKGLNDRIVSLEARNEALEGLLSGAG